jgi:hypothetical protein
MDWTGWKWLALQEWWLIHVCRCYSAADAADSDYGTPPGEPGLWS